MTVSDGVNPKVPTRSLAALVTLVQRLIARKAHLPGLGCFFGPSGAGKTTGAEYVATKYQAAHVMCHQYTTAKSMLHAILIEYGVRKPRGSIPELIEQAIEVLANTPDRPLLIDEAQYVADKRFANVLYHLSDMARTPVILIGEETLPQKLETFERVSRRLLEPVGTVACDLEDFRGLARAFCPRVKISDELAATILRETGGNAGKIVVNLSRVEELAAQDGRDVLDMARFGGAAGVLGVKRVMPRRVA